MGPLFLSYASWTVLENYLTSLNLNFICKMRLVILSTLDTVVTWLNEIIYVNLRLSFVNRHYSINGDGSNYNSSYQYYCSFAVFITCNQGIRNYCIITVMRNLPKRPAALETGIFGQVVTELFQSGKKKGNGGKFCFYVDRGVLPNGAMRNQSCPAEIPSPPSRWLSNFSPYPRQRTHLSNISRTVLTLCRVCRHKGKSTETSDKDIKEELKIRGAAIS